MKPILSEKEEEMVQSYCLENKVKFFKVSAKTGTNITKAYHTLVEEAYVYSYSKRKGKTVPIVIAQDKQ